MDNEIVKNVELINKLPGLLKVKKEVKSIVDTAKVSNSKLEYEENIEQLIKSIGNKSDNIQDEVKEINELKKKDA